MTNLPLYAATLPLRDSLKTHTREFARLHTKLLRLVERCGFAELAHAQRKLELDNALAKLARAEQERDEAREQASDWTARSGRMVEQGATLLATAQAENARLRKALTRVMADRGNSAAYHAPDDAESGRHPAAAGCYLCDAISTPPGTHTALRELLTKACEAARDEAYEVVKDARPWDVDVPAIVSRLLPNEGGQS